MREQQGHDEKAQSTHAAPPQGCDPQRELRHHTLALSRLGRILDVANRDNFILFQATRGLHHSHIALFFADQGTRNG